MKKIDETATLIDELNLDQECIRQPNLYFQAAVMAAEARRDADEKKAEIEIAEAELEKHVRAKPEKYGIDKPTEGAIKAVLASHSKITALEKEYRDLKHQEALQNALVGGLDHKKRSLTLMVNLHSTSYFADVKPNKEGRDVVKDLSRGRLAKAVKKKRDREVQNEDDDE